MHIADVSYFVRAGSALDSAALDRATSTYLVERVVPMLPRPLCEKLCSLNPHENRLTFSVEWTINEKVARLTFSKKRLDYNICYLGRDPVRVVRPERDLLLCQALLRGRPVLDRPRHRHGGPRRRAPHSRTGGG